MSKQISERLDEIELILTKLERGKSDSTQKAKIALVSRKQKSKRAKVDLGTPVKKLIDGGFLRDWKTDNDVVRKLKQQVLTAKRASVSNVLRRFASPAHGLLQREGDGTKGSPWRYKKS